jgi:HD-like signal output (HDOD) protein
MANSAHYGLQRIIGSVEDAIFLVGIDAVRTLVITSGMIGSFHTIPRFDMQRFWRLSLLSALISRDFAKKVKQPPESAYIAALMHGLGILSIHSVFPEIAKEIDGICQDRTVTERSELELEKLGFHHGQVGAEIATRWKIPNAIADAIRFYADPLDINAPALAGLVHCGVALAIDIEDNVRTDQWGIKISETLRQKQGLDWQMIRANEKFLYQQKETAETIVA